MARSPFAPGLLSTTIGWPSSLRRPSASTRATRSSAPPAPNGTTSVIGRDGQASCAATGIAIDEAMIASAARNRIRTIVHLPVVRPVLCIKLVRDFTARVKYCGAATRNAPMSKMHDVRLSPEIVARVMARRGGRMHAIERLDPAKTALLVIDMQNVWVKQGMLAYTPYCEEIVPNINRLAAAIRAAGGSVWWLRAIYGEDRPRPWSAYMEFLAPQFVDGMLAALSEG